MRSIQTVVTFLSILMLLIMPTVQIKLELNSYSIQIESSLYAQEGGGTYQGEKTDEASAMALLTMLAVALVSVGLIKWCPTKPTDVWLAIAAGVAYLGGEAYSMISMKKLKYDSIEYDGTLEDANVKTLEDEKSSYEDVLKIAKTKKMFIMAAAAGYTAAAAMAASLSFNPKDLAASASCGAGDEIAADKVTIDKGDAAAIPDAEDDATNMVESSATDGIGLEKMGAFKLIVLKIKHKVQKFIQDPLNRSILFGSFAAIAYMAMKAVDKMIKKLEKNIKMVEDILANLRERAASAKSIASGGPTIQGISMIQVVPLEELKKLGMHKLAKKLPCVEMVNGKCVSVAASIKNDQRTISLLGSNFAGAADLIGSISDNIQGSQKLTQRLLDDAAKLGGKGAMLKRKLKKIRELVNQKERKEGRRPTNFTQQEKSLNGAIIRSVRRSLKKSGTSASKILGTGTSQSSANEKESVKKEKESKIPKMSAAKGAKKGSKAAPQFDFTLDEDQQSGSTEFAGDLPSTEDFEITAQDIEQRSDVSIFEQISSRYIRSGIPKLFEKSAAELKK